MADSIETLRHDLDALKRAVEQLEARLPPPNPTGTPSEQDIVVKRLLALGPVPWPQPVPNSAFPVE